MRRPSQLPDKLFFRIGEVAELVGVKPHVLRYWEEEFGVLRPMKTRGAHRHYRRRDVELALIIRSLVQDQGFTIAGARKRLREMGHLSRGEEAADTQFELRAELIELRAELAALLARLSPAPALEREPEEASEIAQALAEIRARSREH